MPSILSWRGAEQPLKTAPHKIGAAEAASDRDLRRWFVGLFQQAARGLDAKLEQIS